MSAWAWEQEKGCWASSHCEKVSFSICPETMSTQNELVFGLDCCWVFVGSFCTTVRKLWYFLLLIWRFLCLLWRVKALSWHVIILDRCSQSHSLLIALELLGGISIWNLFLTPYLLSGCPASRQEQILFLGKLWDQKQEIYGISIGCGKWYKNFSPEFELWYSHCRDFWPWTSQAGSAMHCPSLEEQDGRWWIIFIIPTSNWVSHLAIKYLLNTYCIKCRARTVEALKMIQSWGIKYERWEMYINNYNTGKMEP